VPFHGAPTVHDAKSYFGRYAGKIHLPVLQNAMKITCLAQGRINAPPNRQRVAEIGVGIAQHHAYLCDWHLPRFAGG